MKKILLVTILAGTICIVQAQTGGTKPVAKPAPGPVLKTQVDSVSYLLGRLIGKNLDAQGFDLPKINRALFSTGMAEVAAGKNGVLDEANSNPILSNYVQKVKEKQAVAKKAEAKAFFDKNAKRPGVTTLASGLQYEILTLGTGEKMAALDTFICHYRGTLLNGTEFDASYNAGKPLTMSLTQVIQGWQEALPLMPVGSKFKLYIPSQLGYGDYGMGKIPGGATLVFDMELIGFLPKQPKLP